MTYDVVMPQLGMTMMEGSVVQWIKKRGEFVAKGESLFIVQTDKVEMEVEATSSGTVAEHLIEPGTVVPVGTVIGRIADNGTQEIVETPIAVADLALAPLPPPADSQGVSTVPSAAKSSIRKPTNSQKLASPRAKTLAGKFGVDISEVPDYGNRGRVVETDVRRFWEEQKIHPAETGAESSPHPAALKDALTPSRAAIAAILTASAQTIPHFYLDILADATELKKLRESVVNDIERRAGVRLTYTDLLLKSLAIALLKHPEFNTHWTPNGIEHGDHINIGFAAQADGRLLVPVIRDADKLPLPSLAKARSDLVARVRAGKLRAGDTESASLSLSNLGAHGVDSFHAIINPPESAILAVGRIAPRPVVAGELVVARQTIHLSLAVDHRLIDGVAAAAFLTDVTQIVESPYNLLID